MESKTRINPTINKWPSDEGMESRNERLSGTIDSVGNSIQRDDDISRYDVDYQSYIDGSCGSGLYEGDDLSDFISHQNMLHNIIEMLKKLEEQHKELKTKGLYDQIWSHDLETWKQRTQYRINALRVLLGSENGSCNSSFLYNRVLYRPDDYETDDIVQRVNSKYEAFRRKYHGYPFTKLAA